MIIKKSTNNTSPFPLSLSKGLPRARSEPEERFFFFWGQCRCHHAWCPTAAATYCRFSPGLWSSAGVPLGPGECPSCWAEGAAPQPPDSPPRSLSALGREELGLPGHLPSRCNQWGHGELPRGKEGGWMNEQVGRQRLKPSWLAARLPTHQSSSFPPNCQASISPPPPPPPRRWAGLSNAKLFHAIQSE